MSKKVNVLVEANKALSESRDGTTRYVCELLSAIQKLIENDDTQLKVDVFVQQGLYFKIINLSDLADKTDEQFSHDRLGVNRGILPRLIENTKKHIKNHFPEILIQHLSHIRKMISKIIVNLHPRLQFNEYDVVHLTQPQSYLHFENCAAKMVTTIQDLTHLRFPQFHLKENIINADRGMQLVIEKNSEFIAISNATKQDLLFYYPMVKQDHVRVIYDACDTNKFNPCNDPDVLTLARKKYGVPDTPYLLSLSTLEPRKNLINSVKAFLLLINEHPEFNINYVIAGKIGWMQDELLNLTNRHKDRIIIIGFVDDYDLSALYSAAIAFSYVSFYEGFGLPPLEAMSCGVPVIYGNNSSMIEVVDNGGLPADPNDIEDIKEKYRIMISDKDIRATLAKTALKRAHKFSWETTAKETLDTYYNIANSNKGIAQ